MIEFASFDSVFEGLYQYADGTLRLQCVVDSPTAPVWSGEFDEASTADDESVAVSLGNLIMAFVRDEVVWLHNADELNTIFNSLVDEFLLKGLPPAPTDKDLVSPTASPVIVEVYYADNGLIDFPWEAMISIQTTNNGIPIYAYTIDAGSTPGEALRSLVEKVRGNSDAGAMWMPIDRELPEVTFAPNEKGEEVVEVVTSVPEVIEDVTESK